MDLKKVGGQIASLRKEKEPDVHTSIRKNLTY